jgi:hypothetical protein
MLRQCVCRSGFSKLEGSYLQYVSDDAHTQGYSSAYMMPGIFGDVIMPTSRRMFSVCLVKSTRSKGRLNEQHDAPSAILTEKINTEK